MTKQNGATESPKSIKVADGNGAPKIMIPKRKKGSLMDFFSMKTSDVQAMFMGLPGAVKIGDGDESFVYVPPTREKSVLLVAHSDTVWDDQDIAVGYHNGIYGSTKDKVGLGADDRAGITMLWKLRGLGHALLIPNGEEKHGKGSYFLMQNGEWRKKINSHLFAIEMDRMNADDLAFYEVGSLPFKDWCEKEFKGYKRTHGSWTDICALCDANAHGEDCIDGVNISVGYYGQHGEWEHLKLGEWQRTLSLLHQVLSKKDIPSFKHKKWEYKREDFHHTGGAVHIPTTTKVYDNRGTGYPGMSRAPVKHSDNNVMTSILVCPACEAMFDESEWMHNQQCCIYCGRKF